MRNVIADTLGIENLSEYRYQAGKTRRAIYCVDDKYFAVGKSKPKDDCGTWVKYQDQFFAETNNTILWVTL